MQKKMTVTIEDLDITQLWKIRETMHEKICDRGNANGAYRYELRELLDVILLNTQEGRVVFKAPDLTV